MRDEKVIGDSCAFSGMTIREYFAAKAMQGLLANSMIKSELRTDAVATVAVDCADALIAELAKEKSK
jgi:hypothetical protein